MKLKTPEFIRRSFFTKRQRFGAGVVFLSIILLFAEHFLAGKAIFIVFGLSIFTDLFLYWGLRKDLKNNFLPQVFILPFLFTLAFGLFYYSLPQRLLVQISFTILYAVGIYSTYLSENIFAVSTVRTIALLSSARTVSFVLSIFTYAFFTNVLFSSQLSFWIILPILFTYSFLLIIHSLWTYKLEKQIRKEANWALMLSICLTQIAFLLWFWPSKPLIISLFLTDIFYTVVSLSHLWYEKRLFKSVIWEYIWFAFIIFIILVVFTSWT